MQVFTGAMYTNSSSRTNDTKAQKRQPSSRSTQLRIIFNMPYHYIGQLVRPYADRNVLVRNEVREFVAKRRWSGLGGRLAHGRLCRIAQGLSEERIPHGRRG